MLGKCSDLPKFTQLINDPHLVWNTHPLRLAPCRCHTELNPFRKDPLFESLSVLPQVPAVVACCPCGILSAFYRDLRETQTSHSYCSQISSLSCLKGELLSCCQQAEMLEGHRYTHLIVSEKRPCWGVCRIWLCNLTASRTYLCAWVRRVSFRYHPLIVHGGDKFSMPFST